MSLSSLLASFKAGAGKKRSRDEAGLLGSSSSSSSSKASVSNGNIYGHDQSKGRASSSSSNKKVAGEREQQETDTKAGSMEETVIETAEMQGAPHYMILGAQKAGTMAAVKNLNKHPDIFCLKEPHYFDLGWHSKTPSQYRKEFQGKGKAICGEKTPELIYVDECAKRMKTVVSSKNTKFVLFLRDPIKRAYSAWNMNINRNMDSAPFDEVCDRNFQNLDEFRSHGTAEYHYVQRGFYMDQIERFLKVFPNRDNFKIIIAEHMRDPDRAKEIYADLIEYLGAAPFEFEPEDEHVGTYSKSKVEMSASMEIKLMKMYHSHNERLFKFLGFRIDEWTSMASLKAKQAKKEAAKAEAKAETGTGEGEARP